MRVAARWWALLALAGMAGAQETYVGTAVCGTCHDKHARGLRGSVHEKAPVTEGEEPGCEACHGAGSRHLESPATDTIINFRVEEAAVRSERCLRCHPAVRSGRHVPEKVACNDCHSRADTEGFHSLRAGQAGTTIPPRACRRCHANLPASHDLKQSRYQDCLACHRSIHASDRSGRLLQ